MSSLAEIMDAIADRLDTVLGSGGTADPLIEFLQVYPRLTFSPTPPAIDVYPSDPFQVPSAFGPGNSEMFFDVRARVSTAENEGGQDLLLSLMDPNSEMSVIQALYSNMQLGTVARMGNVVGPSSFGAFPDPYDQKARLLGCTWTVRIP